MAAKDSDFSESEICNWWVRQILLTKSISNEWWLTDGGVFVLFLSWWWIVICLELVIAHVRSFLEIPTHTLVCILRWCIFYLRCGRLVLSMLLFMRDGRTFLDITPKLKAANSKILPKCKCCYTNHPQWLIFLYLTIQGFARHCRICFLKPSAFRCMYPWSFQQYIAPLQLVNSRQLSSKLRIQVSPLHTFDLGREDVFQMYSMYSWIGESSFLD